MLFNTLDFESLASKRCLGTVIGCGTRVFAQCSWMPESEEAMDENCERIKKLLELYREDKLNDDEKADVEYHLLVCPECIFLLTLVPAYYPE